MTRNSPTPLDRVIDDVARTMTTGEPSGALRARVLERIASPPAASSIRRWTFFLSAPVAATIVVAIGIAIANRTGAPSRPVEAPTAGVLAARSITLPIAIPELTSAPAPAPAARRSISTTVGASVVAALAPPRLEVSSLALSEIAPGESIEVPRLETIAPIAIAPIGEPEGDRR